MNRKMKTAVSISYGVMLSLMAGLFMAETFLFSSASGTINSSANQNLFDFDSVSENSHASESISLSGDGSAESSAAEIRNTSFSYQEYTYTVSDKEIPYILVSVNLKKTSDFRTRIAVDDDSSYGTNITQSFESMISDAEKETGDEVLFAIDGDYPFWSGRDGYVIRNGIEYRKTKREDSSSLDFALFKDGAFKAFDEEQVSFDTLMNMNGGCYQNWSFGPALLVNSVIKVSEDQDVSQSMSANQRISMGYKDDGTLLFLCSNTNDGKRRGSSVGLSLYQMAEILKDEGCTLAYNFDGGGSVNMFLKGYGSDGYYMKQTRKLGDIIYVVNS